MIVEHAVAKQHVQQEQGEGQLEQKRCSESHTVDVQ